MLTASDGQQAVESASQYPPGIVILDIFMPKPDGLEVCRRLKGDARTMHAKVLILTAYDTPEHRQAAQTAGADAFFPKPYSPLALLRAVNDAASTAQEEDAP